jgi:hypothetical protein
MGSTPPVVGDASSRVERSRTGQVALTLTSKQRSLLRKEKGVISDNGRFVGEGSSSKLKGRQESKYVAARKASVAGVPLL